MKLILFIGGGEESLPAINLAKKLNLKVAVIDMDENCPCFAVSDYKIICSTYDVDSCVYQAEKFHKNVYKISGVICVAADVPLSVASVADSLNLPGIPVDAARITSDKLLMKDKFKQNEIAIPWYREIFSHKEVHEIIHSSVNDYVIKPVDSRGARGVQKINSSSNLKEAYLEAKKNSPTHRVMLEKYISGPQLSTESLIIDSKSHTIGLSDRNYDLLDKYSPFIIEDGGDLPASLNDIQKKNVNIIIDKVAKSLNVKNGVIKGDIVFESDSDDPIIIEVATRLSGGYFCSHEIPLSTGVDFLGAAIKLAIGDKININSIYPTENNFVSQRYLFAEEGVVKTIPDIEEIKKMEGIKLAVLRAKIGDKIYSAKSHPGRAGLVIATGKSRHNAITNASNAINRMQKNLLTSRK